VSFATAGVEENDLETKVSVVTCRWEGERCGETRSGEDVRTGEYDAAGLVRVHRGGAVVWDRGLHAVSDDLLAPDTVLAAWADGLAAAVARMDERGVLIRVFWSLRVHDEPFAVPVGTGRCSTVAHSRIWRRSRSTSCRRSRAARRCPRTAGSSSSPR
jgi:hypothetical protein